MIVYFINIGDKMEKMYKIAVENFTKAKIEPKEGMVVAIGDGEEKRHMKVVRIEEGHAILSEQA